jgi:fructokinase
MKLGIDLGGTKIEIVSLDQDGRELFRTREPTPSGDYSATLLTIVKLVHDAESWLGPASSIGIGTPGSLSKATGLLRNSNSTCLNGRPFLRDIESHLNRKVKIANDANCFALSEATDGAASGYEIVFGVIVGTGTGAGIVVGGRALTGINGISGEWGHNPLPWPEANELPGLPCYCGKSGCIETFLSGPGMSAWHLQAFGKSLSPEEIVRGAEKGDRDCEESLQIYESRFARSLSHVINILDPDAIVLGGGLSNIDRLYRNIPAIWGNWVFSDRVDTRLVKHAHGDSSGVRGAARL